LPRAFEWKPYHSSNRCQRAGSTFVEGCVWSATSTVAVWFSGWLPKYAPTRPPYQFHVYSVSLAACTPA